MKIVIDIPEEKYKVIQDGNYCGVLNDELYYAVKNGTPLPKGHGRLDVTNESVYDHGFNDAVDMVSEIITETEKYEKKLTTPLTTPIAFGFRLAVEHIKREVEVLKGGEQE